MTEYTCERCGASYAVGRDGDPFTTITVSYHDDSREDVAKSVCQPCGDAVLAGVIDALGIHAEEVAGDV